MGAVAVGASNLSVWIGQNPMLLIYVVVVFMILYGIVWAYYNGLIG